MEALGLDEVWWLVSPGNPLKAGAKDMAPFAARFASAEAMALPWRRIQGQRFRGSGGHSLHRRHGPAAPARYPDDRFIWLMGEDTVAQFHQWKNWRKLAESLPIAVIHRPGYDQSRPTRRARWAGSEGSSGLPARQEHWTEWSAPAILLASPAARSDFRHRLTRARSQLARRVSRTPNTGSKRFAMPTSVRRALARPSH